MRQRNADHGDELLLSLDLVVQNFVRDVDQLHQDFLDFLLLAEQLLAVRHPGNLDLDELELGLGAGILNFEDFVLEKIGVHCDQLVDGKQAFSSLGSEQLHFCIIWLQFFGFSENFEDFEVKLGTGLVTHWHCLVDYVLKDLVLESGPVMLDEDDGLLERLEHLAVVI